jgi:hypothetical protein
MSPRPVMKVIEGMRCDGVSRVLIGCSQPVLYGVRIHVPSRTQFAPDHAQVRITLTLHTCALHREAFKLDDLLSDGIKEQVERFAKAKRPIDWKPDYDAAFIQYVDIHSPEYARFVRSIEGGVRAEAEQLWGAPIANA